MLYVIVFALFVGFSGISFYLSFASIFVENIATVFAVILHASCLAFPVFFVQFGCSSFARIIFGKVCMLKVFCCSFQQPANHNLKLKPLFIMLERNTLFYFNSVKTENFRFAQFIITLN